MDWRRVLEEVAFAGPEGLSKDNLIPRLKKIFPDYKFDDFTIPILWKRICGQPEVTSEAERAWIRADARESILLEGRAVKLTDYSRSLLDLIASSGPDGIVQPELGRKLRMDQRNLAYHINSIHQHGLILRLPVSVKKTFTYLCVMARWVQSEANLPIQRIEGTGAEVTFRPPPAQMMARITQLLSSAPDQTLTTKELYEYSGLPAVRGLYKWFNQILGQLVESGHVEILLMGGIGGPRCRVYRFKSLHDGLEKADLTSSQPSSSQASTLLNYSPSQTSNFVQDLNSSQLNSTEDIADGESEEEDSAGPIGPLLRPFISLDKQARDLVADAGAKGLVLGDLRKSLGLNPKAVYRIHTRLTSKKPTTNSDVVKVTEFQGKERRHRLFVEAAQSGPIGPVGPSESKRDSLTRDVRKQCFMKLLMSYDPPIVEANRSLGIELGALMVQQSFEIQAKQHAVDNKTIRRVVDQLSQDGLVKQIVIGLPNRVERTLVVPVSMSDDDPQLQMRIQAIKDKPRIYDLTRELADPLPPVDDKLDIPLEEHKRRLAHFGLVYGTMARAQLLHEYICSKVKPGEVFETPRLMFEDLPFSLFLQLASISSVSAELEAFINDKTNHSVSLKAMPQKLYHEISRKRFTAYRRTVRNLLSHLTSLGLIVAVDEYSLRRLNLQIPLMLRLSSVIHVTGPPDARSTQVIALTGPEDVQEYWRLARENWSGQVFEATAELAPVYNHMVLRQSWMKTKPKVQNTLTDSQIDEVARELGVPVEEVRRTMLRPLRKRTIGIMTDLTKADTQSRKKAKLMTKRPPVTKMVPLSEWSQQDRATAQLIYVLLHDPALYRGQIVSWFLATGLIPNRESTEIRLYLTRAALSDWDWMKQILKLEARVNLVKHVHKVGTPACNEDSDDVRVAAFHAYFNHMVELLQKDDDGIAEGTGVGPLRTVWKLGKTRMMDEWQRGRHYRTPLIQQFDESSYTIPMNQDDGLILPEDEVLKAVSAIKMVMTWPGPRYIATVGAQVLADLHPGALKEALEILLSLGFLTKASGGRNRYRVPGTPYALSHRSVALLLTDSSYTGPANLGGMAVDSTTVNSFDFNLFMDMAVSGLLTGKLGIDGEQVSVKLSGAMNDPLALSLDQSVELMRRCGVFDDTRVRTWFWPSTHPLDTSSDPAWHFNSDLFKNALRAVCQAVDQEPAMSLASLNSAFWPILDPSEVTDILTCLQSLGLVTHTYGRYFPSISR